jgi:LEA14-like dessication related protein
MAGVKAGHIVAAVVALAVLTAAGVYVWRNITKQPEVEVTGFTYNVTDEVTVLGVSIPTEVSVLMELEIQNPNIIPIMLSGGTYTVELNNISVGEGTIPAFKVPAGSKRKIDSEVRFSAVSSLKAVLNAVKEGSLAGRVSGEVYVNIPVLGRITIPFTEERDIIS